MAGFRKAKAEQAALKVGLYGLPGSGKTFTALLCAEGLAKISGKRVAFVDTERGTDFYAQAVASRAIHPEAFDFDALYTRSIVEIGDACRSLDTNKYGVLVIDSITHVWEAARAAYRGRETKVGTIPFHAWASIKKPYKELMAFLLASPLHVFILGRQGNEFEEDQETGETKKVGVKMKAEGETAYEPHILIHMEPERNKDGTQTVVAFAEKDRTGILSGKVFRNPTFDALIKPILPLLGATKQATVAEAAGADAEALAQKDAEAAAKSADTAKRLKARIELADGKSALDAIGKEITPALKETMTAADVADVREAFLARQKQFAG